jgi:hypothetical protein
MNERIRELAEQAWDATAVSKDFGHPVSFAEKFAEMIVRECAKTVESKADRWGNMTDEIINECILECAKDLLKHFGVEE